MTAAEKRAKQEAADRRAREAAARVQAALEAKRAEQAAQTSQTPRPPQAASQPRAEPSTSQSAARAGEAPSSAAPTLLRVEVAVGLGPVLMPNGQKRAQAMEYVIHQMSDGTRRVASSREASTPTSRLAAVHLMFAAIRRGLMKGRI